MKSKPEDKHFKGKNAVLAKVAGIKQEKGAGKKLGAPVLAEKHEEKK